MQTPVVQYYKCYKHNTHTQPDYHNQGEHKNTLRVLASVIVSNHHIYPLYSCDVPLRHWRSCRNRDMTQAISYICENPSFEKKNSSHEGKKISRIHQCRQLVN